MRRYRQTKIVATLGPSSSEEPMIRKLLETGVDVFRLNFSHGTHDDHRARLQTIRALQKEYDRPIGILADLQGPKFRIGQFKNGAIDLHEGMKLRFDLDPALGDETRVCLPHAEVLRALNEESEILLDDGKVRVRVLQKSDGALDVEVLAGIKLSNNKGFNVPGVVLPVSALTEKDRLDLTAALDMGADWIAQSFVQRAEDVAETKKLIQGRAALMAKIEKPSAVKHLDEILDHVDGIMLARGDLGVEMPPEDVPALQKRIVRQVRTVGKPVIVATQMLESMIENPRPTRAEASDVATAVYDGTDAVMLSAETASGHYPVEAVSMMDRICQRTEADPAYREIIESNQPKTENDASDAITVAATYVARDTHAAAIVNYTSSGSTTLRTVRQRPDIPILCLTQNISTACRLMLSYGVRTFHVTDVSSFAETVKKATKLVKEKGYAQKGERIVLTAGVPFGTPGSTNVLRVAWVE
ncbi:MAG: pyruvate kinase [Rhodospirillales bacterium]|nr:pyruvate kinase [Alphaproteobacteria bacterium]USO04564.1 MAG: pyruvate kinase [Rhodospirillales bacterium]